MTKGKGVSSVLETLIKGGMDAKEAVQSAKELSGDSTTNLVNSLVGRGMKYDDAIKAVRKLPGAKREVLGSVLGFLGPLVTGAFGTSVVSSVLDSIQGPKPAEVTTDSSTGKYFQDAGTDIAYERDYFKELFRRAMLGKIGFDVTAPLPRSPEEFRAENEARTLRMAEDLTRREMLKREQELEADILRERIMRGSLRDIAELQGLSNVQQERLKGSYGLAQGVLENAIENVLKSGTITDRSAEVELAKIQ